MALRVLLIDNGPDASKRWRVLLATVSVSLGFVGAGCSSTSNDNSKQPAASAGGSSGSSGHTGSGGTGAGGSSSGGETGTGGGPPAECAGVDAGTDECTYCLATKCCADTESCFRDSSCADQFDTYQSCVKEPGSTNPSGCYSTFTRVGAGDSGKGAGPHENLYKCIAFMCKACGAPSVL